MSSTQVLGNPQLLNGARALASGKYLSGSDRAMLHSRSRIATIFLNSSSFLATSLAAQAPHANNTSSINLLAVILRFLVCAAAPSVSTRSLSGSGR